MRCSGGSAAGSERRATSIAEGGLRDAEIVARCAADGRILLTRDRHLAALAESRVRVLSLAKTDLGGQARALRAALGIDWMHAPFTRCLVDNAPLMPASTEMEALVPQKSRAAVGLQPTSLSHGGSLRLCPECGRLYWPGGHVRRMLARLAEWKAA